MKIKIMLIILSLITFCRCCSAYSTEEWEVMYRVDDEIRVGNYTKAIEICTEAINKNPSVFYNRLGDIYLKTKNYDQAIVEYTKVINLSPSNLNENYDLQGDSAYYSRGVAYEKKGNYEQALSDYFTKKKMNRSTCERIARISYKYTKNYKLALEYINKAIEFIKLGEKIPQEYGYYYTIRAGINYKLGNIDQAIDDYKKAINSYKVKIDTVDYYNPYYNLACIYFDQGNYDEAVKYVSSAIIVEEDFASAYYLRALCYEKQTKIDLAEKDYAKAKEYGYQGKDCPELVPSVVEIE